MTLDLFLLWLPVTVASIVFGMSIAILPKEVSLTDVATPEHIAERGYSPLAVSLALQTEIDKVVERTGWYRDASKLRVGAHRTGLEQLAHVVGVERAVRAVQQTLGISGAYVEVIVTEDETRTLFATVTVRDSKTLDLIAETRLRARPNTPEALVARIGEYVLETTQPAVYASYLYTRTLDGDLPTNDVLTWIEDRLRDENVEDAAELHNLRGLIALDVGDHAAAIASFRTGAAHDPTLALNYTNWGRTWLELGQGERAAEYFALARRAGRGVSPMLDVYHARALLAGGDVQGALRMLARAARETPHLAALHDARVDAYRALGDRAAMNAARADARRARAHRPDQHGYLPY